MVLNDEQYNRIERIYEIRRDENEAALSSRRDEVYAKVPELKSLDNEIADLSLACSMRLMSTTDESERSSLGDDLQTKIDAIEDRKFRLITAAGFPDDYLEMTYHCDKCKDTGSENGSKCTCYRQLEAALLSDESRIRSFLDGNNFSRLDEHFYKDEDLSRFRDAVQKSEQFIKSFGKDYHNMLFYGTVGTGKSFLSGCIAKELLDRGFSVLYFSAELLTETISAAIKSDDKRAMARLQDSLYETDLLIIDDLGTEMINDFTRTHILNILNERVLRQHPLIISTNLNLNELRDIYSERFASRLYANAYICRLSGKDIRLLIKMEQTAGTGNVG